MVWGLPLSLLLPCFLSPLSPDDVPPPRYSPSRLFPWQLCCPLIAVETDRVGSNGVGRVTQIGCALAMWSLYNSLFPSLTLILYPLLHFLLFFFLFHSGFLFFAPFLFFIIFLWLYSFLISFSLSFICAFLIVKCLPSGFHAFLSS